LDIFLGSVLDSNETESQLDLLVHDHSLGIGSSVHDIDLGDDSHSSDSLGVQSLSHQQTLTGGHIGVGWHDTENNGSGVGTISLGHLSGDLGNVGWLTLDGDQSDTWEIDESEVWARVRVNIEDNWLIYNVGLILGDLISELNNHVLHFGEVSEFLTLALDGELGPWDVVLGLVMETKLKGTSRHDSITSGKAVETDDGLEDGGFTCGLGTKNRNSWQLDVLLNTHIPQIINDGDEFLKLGIHHIVAPIIFSLCHGICLS
jgi:hypothetical protein